MQSNEPIESIIVHPGNFQVDETLAVSVVRYLFPYLQGVRISRRRPSVADLNNPRRLVLDCGEQFAPHLNNFDHHQDKKLHCTCRMVWRQFAPEDTPLRKQVKQAVDKLFFRSIDRHDRGITFSNNNSISTVVSAMNYLPNGFDSALCFTDLALRAIIARQNEMIPIRNLWKSGVSFGGTHRLKILPDTLDDRMKDSFMEYARVVKNALYIVWPISGGYVVHMVHNNQRIPFDYRQSSLYEKFAVYPKKEVAMTHALELVAKKMEKDARFKQRVA